MEPVVYWHGPVKVVTPTARAAVSGPAFVSVRSITWPSRTVSGFLRTTTTDPFRLWLLPSSGAAPQPYSVVAVDALQVKIESAAHAAPIVLEAASGEARDALAAALRRGLEEVPDDALVGPALACSLKPIPASWLRGRYRPCLMQRAGEVDPHVELEAVAVAAGATPGAAGGAIPALGGAKASKASPAAGAAASGPKSPAAASTSPAASAAPGTAAAGASPAASAAAPPLPLPALKATTTSPAASAAAAPTTGGGGGAIVAGGGAPASPAAASGGAAAAAPAAPERHVVRLDSPLALVPDTERALVELGLPQGYSVPIHVTGGGAAVSRAAGSAAGAVMNALASAARVAVDAAAGHYLHFTTCLPHVRFPSRLLLSYEADLRAYQDAVWAEDARLRRWLQTVADLLNGAPAVGVAVADAPASVGKPVIARTEEQHASPAVRALQRELTELSVHVTTAVLEELTVQERLGRVDDVHAMAISASASVVSTAAGVLSKVALPVKGVGLAVKGARLLGSGLAAAGHADDGGDILTTWNLRLVALRARHDRDGMHSGAVGITDGDDPGDGGARSGAAARVPQPPQPATDVFVLPGVFSGGRDSRQWNPLMTLADTTATSLIDVFWPPTQASQAVSRIADSVTSLDGAVRMAIEVSTAVMQPEKIFSWLTSTQVILEQTARCTSATGAALAYAIKRRYLASIAGVASANTSGGAGATPAGSNPHGDRPRIVLVAHSFGAGVVLHALAALACDPEVAGAGPLVDTVVLLLGAAEAPAPTVGPAPDGSGLLVPCGMPGTLWDVAQQQVRRVINAYNPSDYILPHWARFGKGATDAAAPLVGLRQLHLPAGSQGCTVENIDISALIAMRPANRGNLFGHCLEAGTLQQIFGALLPTATSGGSPFPITAVDPALVSSLPAADVPVSICAAAPGAAATDSAATIPVAATGGAAATIPVPTMSAPPSIALKPTGPAANTFMPLAAAISASANPAATAAAAAAAARRTRVAPDMPSSWNEPERIIGDAGMTLECSGDVASVREHVRNVLSDEEAPWSKWTVPRDVSAGWLVVRFAAPTRVTRYALKAASGEPGRDPKDWELQAHVADGPWPDLAPAPAATADEGWELLHAVTDATFPSRLAVISHDLPEPALVHALRLKITRTVAKGLQLAQLQLWRTPFTPLVREVPATALAMSATGAAPGGASGPENLLQPAAAPGAAAAPVGGKRWWTNPFRFSGAAAVTARFADGQARRIAGYTLTAAPDAPERDPSTWRLEGLAAANPDVWVTLHAVAAFEFAARGETALWTFDSSVAVSAVRLHITAVREPVSGVHLARVRFFEEVPAADAAAGAGDAATAACDDPASAPVA